MSTPHVPFKTQLGHDELRTRTHRLSQRHRTILLLVDGRRPLAEVLNLAQKAGAAISHFEDVLRMGLVELPIDVVAPDPVMTEPGALATLRTTSIEVDVADAAFVGGVSDPGGLESASAAAAVPAEPVEPAVVGEVILGSPVAEPAPAALSIAPIDAGPALLSAPLEKTSPDAAPPPPPEEIVVAADPPHIEVPPAEPVAAPATADPATAPATAAMAPAVRPDPVAPIVEVPVKAKRAPVAPASPARRVFSSLRRSGPRRADAADAPPAPGLERLAAAPAAATRREAPSGAPDLVTLTDLSAVPPAPPAFAPQVAPATEALVQQVRTLLADTVRQNPPPFASRLPGRLASAQTLQELRELVLQIERYLSARRTRTGLGALEHARELLGLGNTVVAEDTRSPSPDDDDGFAPTTR
jgi:hypothetical protein